MYVLLGFYSSALRTTDLDQTYLEHIKIFPQELINTISSEDCHTKTRQQRYESVMETPLLTLISQSCAADKQIFVEKVNINIWQGQGTFPFKFPKIRIEIETEERGSFAQMISDSVSLPPSRLLMLMAIETHQHNLMLCQMSLIKEAHQGSGIIDIQTQIYTNNNKPAPSLHCTVVLPWVRH